MFDAFPAKMFAFIFADQTRETALKIAAGPGLMPGCVLYIRTSAVIFLMETTEYTELQNVQREGESVEEFNTE